MSRGKWRVSKKRLAALDAEVAEIVDAQETIHAAPGQMTNADWDAIADLNRRYARATDARDRMRFTLGRKQRERERARLSNIPGRVRPTPMKQQKL